MISAIQPRKLQTEIELEQCYSTDLKEQGDRVSKTIIGASEKTELCLFAQLYYAETQNSLKLPLLQFLKSNLK